MDLWDYKTKKEKGLIEYITAVMQAGSQIIPKLAWIKAPGKEKKTVVSAAAFVGSDPSRDFFKTLTSALVEQAESVTG